MLKETRNSCFCVIPKNQALHKNNSKKLYEDIFHWLEVITEILNFLQIFSVRKQHSVFLNISKNLQENRQKKLYFWHILGL